MKSAPLVAAVRGTVSEWKVSPTRSVRCEILTDEHGPRVQVADVYHGRRGDLVRGRVPMRLEDVESLIAALHECLAIVDRAVAVTEEYGWPPEARTIDIQHWLEYGAA